MNSNMEISKRNANSDTGYHHEGYVHSLSEFGQPLHLPRCDGWILQRAIPGSDFVDAMGPYPLFCCHDWSQLGADLEAAPEDLISLVMVADPFATSGESELRRCFDQVVHFKDHVIADLSRSPAEFVSKSHQATVRRAKKKVDVRLCEQPSDYIGKWVDLFGNLVQRHNISGLRAFSKEAFEQQLALPGLVMFEALVENETVGLDLWYVKDDVAYGHLVAFSDSGYKARASYATKWAMLEHFTGQVRWVDLGAGAGADKNSNDGLTKFKMGWATGTKPALLCGRIFQKDIYDSLCQKSESGDTRYFPAYRGGEFDAG